MIGTLIDLRNNPTINHIANIGIAKTKNVKIYTTKLPKGLLFIKNVKTVRIKGNNNDMHNHLQ
ncbi:hypothetical protein LCR01_14260 [Companilactobacillus crustorum]|uniref:Uncharacterized protein n=1 Tax=Companilactobacillus crustorum TaxID=392416 RepID=A0AB34ACL6_9LACO|nr:hypothetical protein LCR01_14260 [Companilactobacillus crustorum]